MKSIRPLFVFLLAGLVAFAVGCQQPPPEQPDTRAADAAAIRSASGECAAAAAEKDLDKTMSFFADDALMMPSNAPLVSGKDAVRQEWEKMMATPGYALSWEPVQVEVARSGDFAFERGTYQFTQNDPKGNPVTVVGKYLTVVKKQADGSWKVVIDISNRDE